MKWVMKPPRRSLRAARAHIVRYEQERVLRKEKSEEPATPTWLIAVRAAESKKASDIKVLDLTGITSFADFFVICTGANQRQIQPANCRQFEDRLNHIRANNRFRHAEE